MDRLIHPALHGKPVAWFASTYNLLADVWREQQLVSSGRSVRLVEKLGGIGARAGEFANTDVDQQIRAIQLPLACGYSTPRGNLKVQPQR